ncbi:hypothetical protein FG379_001365 [Cryptosporidium bovis]|uniref:uncharacterized protein n=1 Tax=Cryptosporidium bovis TaxID=310047 RepID=UPI00351A79C6|nr:hypothetical protein FG379_001365 [Cryptosporidium bovis]
MTSNDSVDSSIYCLTIFHRQTCVFHLNVVEAEATNYWRNFLSKPSTRVECCDLRTSNKKFSPKRYFRQIKLLNGLLFSMKSFCKRLIPNVNAENEGFNSYTTPMYKLFCFETLSGHKFILMTNPSVYYGNELLNNFDKYVTLIGNFIPQFILKM